jgi:transcription initiation factor TFIIIB Brf1 subunit/transcription initiation factor TFIIB
MEKEQNYCPRCYHATTYFKDLDKEGHYCWKCNNFIDDRLILDSSDLVWKLIKIKEQKRGRVHLN